MSPHQDGPRQLHAHHFQVVRQEEWMPPALVAVNGGRTLNGVVR